MSDSPNETKAAFTPDEMAELKKFASDYARCSWVGRSLMRWAVRIGAFAIGIATFWAAISTALHNNGGRVL